MKNLFQGVLSLFAKQKGRTMTTATIEQVDPAVEQIQEKVRSLEVRQQQLTGDKEASENLKKDLEEERRGLIVRYSNGEQQAAMLADENEHKQARIDKKLEGLKIQLEQLEEDLQFVYRERTELFTRIGEENRRKEIEELKAESARLMHNLQAHTQRGCRAAHALGVFLTEVNRKTHLSEEERISVAMAARAMRVMDIRDWQHPPSPAGDFATLTIRPLLPRDDQRHLEELK